jgi:hypothetical protein
MTGLAWGEPFLGIALWTYCASWWPDAITWMVPASERPRLRASLVSREGKRSLRLISYIEAFVAIVIMAVLW